MEGDRIARARARIEEAVRRIEAAAARPAPSPETAEQARKYEVLRGEAQAALAELDHVIAALEA